MKTKLIVSVIKKIAFSRIGKKLLFSFIDSYVDATETQFDNNLRDLIKKLFDNDADIRPEVARLTEILFEKYGKK